MHVVGLAKICLCLLTQVCARATPQLLPRQASARLQRSPLPAPVDTPLRDANDEVSTMVATCIDTSRTTPTISVNLTPTCPRNHNVAVAQNGTQFTPGRLKNIPIGDTLTFYVYPRNFSVVQSSLDVPCQPLLHSIYTSFHSTEENSGIARQKFVVTVANTETARFYAVDGNVLANGGVNVCEKGITIVLNALAKSQAAGRTLNPYKRHATNFELIGKQSNTVPILWTIRGEEVRGISEKDKARWEGKHFISGTASLNATNVSTGGVDGASESTVAAFRIAGIVGKGNKFYGYCCAGRHICLWAQVLRKGIIQACLPTGVTRMATMEYQNSWIHFASRLIVGNKTGHYCL